MGAARMLPRRGGKARNAHRVRQDQQRAFMPFPNPRSAMDGMTFPALPDVESSARLALLFQLEQSQWWPADVLRRHQMAQLGALLAHAAKHVPFYRSGPHALPAGEIDEATWLRLPVLTRRDVQLAGDVLVAEWIPPAHGGVTETFTSGSTGRPVRVLRTELWELMWSAFTLRDHLWHGRDLSGKLAAIRESGEGKALYPDGERAATWGRASGQAFKTGPFVSLNVTTPVEQMAAWLAREDPDYLLTHPSIAWRLARHFLQAGQRLSRLKQVETIAEAVPADLHVLCREAWGASVVDIYSAREAGYIAFQCPEHEHYHVQSEGILVEVIGEDGRACRPGEIGRVIVTPLHNFAMPLLRYDIGDYAEAGEPCPCGRGLPVLTRILGRRQNMLRKPGGGELWSLLSSSDLAHLLSLAPIRQYQIAQTRPDALVLRVVAARPLVDAEREALSEWAAKKFAAGFRIAVTEHDELPRGPGGKFHDVLNEVADSSGGLSSRKHRRG
jgi:phenylacetate-CoA ligase